MSRLEFLINYLLILISDKRECDPETEFSCNNGKCIPVLSKCDFDNDSEKPAHICRNKRSTTSRHEISGKANVIYVFYNSCKYFKTLCIFGIPIFCVIKNMVEKILFFRSKNMYHRIHCSCPYFFGSAILLLLLLITDYGLRIMDYESRITNYELRITDYHCCKLSWIF